MKKVLLPTDFSSNSENALDYAIKLYWTEACEFILLHSYEVNGFVKNSTFVPKPSERCLKEEKCKVENKLQKLLTKIRRQQSNLRHSFRTKAENQHLVNILNKEVIDSSCELIIIGTQGITNSIDVAFGINTKKILKEVTNCPILAIPSHVTFSKIKEIVIATGFKTIPQFKEFSFIKELVNKNNAKVRILHIDEGGGLTTSQKKNMQLLFYFLEDVSYSYHSLTHVTIPIGIYTFTESRGSNLLVFINRKHSFLENILFDHSFKSISNYTTIPVLVIQATP